MGVEREEPFRTGEEYPTLVFQKGGVRELSKLERDGPVYEILHYRKVGHDLSGRISEGR